MNSKILLINILLIFSQILFSQQLIIIHQKELNTLIILKQMTFIIIKIH